jgi:molybdopterin molybdotransferase
MAQLSDDCFAFGGALLGVDAALDLIRSASRPSCPRGARCGGCGRISRDLVAAIDAAAPNSAVDGYAVAHADLLPTATRLAGHRTRCRRHPLGRPAARGGRSASSPARRCPMG